MTLRSLLEVAIGPAAGELTEDELALLEREATWVEAARERVRHALADLHDPGWSIGDQREA